MIVLADVHIGLNLDNSIFHKVSLDLFRDVFRMCKERNITTIAVLGDLFHNPKTISQKSLDVARKIINTALKLNITMILVRGNHDSYYKETPHPNWLTAFKKYKNVITVEDKEHVQGNCCFVPWSFDISTLDFSGYLFGHFEINSFMMNDSFECYSAKLSPYMFKKFKHVYSGHFHFPSSKDNITYLGSPFQQNFKDCNSTRSYYIFNDGKLEAIEFTNAPKFYKINSEEFNTHYHLVKNNFITLVLDKDYGISANTKLISKIEACSPLTLNIDTSKLGEFESLSQENIGEIKDNLDLLFEFLEKADLPEYLKRSTLTKIILQLTKETL